MTEKSVAQEQPASGQLAKAGLAIRQGRAAEWIVEQLNGIEFRRALTDALQYDRYWAAFFADARRRSRLRRVALMNRDVLRRRRAMS